MSPFHKYHLLFDEGFPLRTFFPKINSTHMVQHIAKDLNKSGLSDLEVFKIADKNGQLLVTYNYRDFRNFLATSNKAGIIGVSASLPLEQIDKKISSLLSKSKPKNLYGKFNYISGETK